MPPDFRQFLQMMTVEFGERFIKLFRGPGWSGLDRADHKDPYKVSMYFVQYAIGLSRFVFLLLMLFILFYLSIFFLIY